MLPKLRQVVEDPETVAGRWFALTVQALIVLSLISFSVETLPNLPEWANVTLGITEMVTVAIFTAEYLLRVAVAEKKRAFVFSFFGVVDLLAILPFYVSAGVDLRSLRAFRMLRLVRIFKLVRYSRALRRFHRAFVIAREEILLFLFAALIVVFLSAVGMYYFESEAQPEAFASVFHALWWSISTLTTVGYGDVYPVTLGGRIFTALVLAVGLGIVAVPSGLVAAALSKARDEEQAAERARDGGAATPRQRGGDVGDGGAH